MTEQLELSGGAAQSRRRCPLTPAQRDSFLSGFKLEGAAAVTMPPSILKSTQFYRHPPLTYSARFFPGSAVGGVLAEVTVEPGEDIAEGLVRLGRVTYQRYAASMRGNVWDLRPLPKTQTKRKRKEYDDR